MKDKLFWTFVGGAIILYFLANYSVKHWGLNLGAVVFGVLAVGYLIYKVKKG